MTTDLTLRAYNAAKASKVKQALEAVEQGADVFAVDGIGDSITIWLARDGFAEAVLEIAKKHPKVLEQVNRFGDTPAILLASHVGVDIETLMRLVAINPNIKMQGGIVATAIRCQKIEMAKTLYQLGFAHPDDMEQRLHYSGLDADGFAFPSSSV